MIILQNSKGKANWSYSYLILLGISFLISKTFLLLTDSTVKSFCAKDFFKPTVNLHSCFSSI
jgi:hypothetical protein